MTASVRKSARRLESWVVARSFWILSTLALVLAIISSGLPLLLSKGMSNLTLVGTIIEGESFITVAVACYAAIIPIVFSVSTLAIQHAAGNYTASILEDYKKDRKTYDSQGNLIPNVDIRLVHKLDLKFLLEAFRTSLKRFFDTAKPK